MKKIMLLNGPNLNMLGVRQPELYGERTLSDIVGTLREAAKALELELVDQQSNAEHVLIEAIHQAPANDVQFILINAGALTHTSLALRDALLAVGIPFIEIHMSNVYARESYRQTSFLADQALGVITGFGPQSYALALLAAHHFLEQSYEH